MLIMAYSGVSYAQTAGHQAQHSGVQRTEADYKIPTLKLKRRDGSIARFPDEINDGKPVILTFDFTTCTTVCPVISGVFNKVFKKLTSDGEDFHMVSISIDPEYDTPAVLSEFDKKIHDTQVWQHYTGSSDDSITMQKAFLVYRGDKMNHKPVIFIKPAKNAKWIRLEGIPTAAEVLDVYTDAVHGAQ